MKQLDESKIIITHALFTGNQVAWELTELGYPVINENKLHTEIKGSLRDTVRLNLYMRTAHRILFYLNHFHARNLDDLYREVKKYPWEEIIPLKGYFTIHSFVKQGYIKDFRIVNLKMKDAIADRFQERYRKRPDSGNRHDQLVLFIRWVEDQCEIYLDTSGETLSRHGYRKHSWKAPLSESLAASIIYAMNWDQISTFINPMCGSGTLAIEAAMMASNRFPGIYRENYSFLHLREPLTDAYQEEKAILLKAVIPECSCRILGSDIHPEAIHQSQLNAREAGVQRLIQFESKDFEGIEIPAPPGVLVLNPGYGRRVGEEEKLGPLYEKIGNFFKKKCQGYTGYVFTGNLDLGKKVGLRTNRRIPFLNGNIECRLLEYELYAGSKKNNPES